MKIINMLGPIGGMVSPILGVAAGVVRSEGGVLAAALLAAMGAAVGFATQEILKLFKQEISIKIKEWQNKRKNKN